MKRKKARHFTAEEKVAILREHLIDGQPISDVCDKHDLRPNMFYRWQKQFFEQGAAAFKNQRSKDRQVNQLQEQIEKLEAKLQTKNEVLSELMEEHLMLKKKSGDR